VCLSKLYCLQGKFQEAKELANDVLQERPWHFGALETMRVVSLALHDEINLSIWDARRMPPPSTEERKQWVDRAIADATVLLAQSEQVRQHDDKNDNSQNDE